MPGEPGICEQECKPTNQVAFFAGLSSNCNARGEAIPFDAVMTNQCDDCPGEAATKGLVLQISNSLLLFDLIYDSKWLIEGHRKGHRKIFKN